MKLRTRKEDVLLLLAVLMGANAMWLPEHGPEHAGVKA
jgi:hypothetical protein